MVDYRFDHVHLNSPDPLKTARFYETMFGARRVTSRQVPGGSVVWLDLNSQKIIIGTPVGSPPLTPAAVQPQDGLIHFALRTDNLEKAVAELKAKGVTFVQEITSVTPLTSVTNKISYFIAPENVLIELQQY